MTTGRLQLSSAISILLLLALATVTGCIEEKKEYSEVMTEKATVLEVVFSPARHGSDLAPTIGFSGSGNMTLGVASVDVDIPEVYAVIFKCEQHGVKFIIQNPHKRAKDLWNRLKKDQVVTVEYREIFKVTYDGGKMVKKEKLPEYDFVNAY